MNYLPFCGYWFYGAADDQERAAVYCSWGLLFTAPISGLVVPVFMHYYRRRRM